MGTAQKELATAAVRTTWQIDPAHTEAGFAVRHLMVSTVKGRFAGVTGRIVLDEANPAQSSVEVTIAAASIDTREEKRDAHLRSADFFDAEKYPALTFRSRRVEPAGEGRFRVVGDLTIKGVTREVVLRVEDGGRAQDPWGGERIGYSAETKIDRRDFGLTWNQALETGGVVVGNEVRILLEVEAVRQAAEQAA
ncbi:MAG: polyisoprenoid-binding protein [Gemmatimonadetes bacterium]|nr:polyisoprenoid-binding protein [Gemmatimonadota bacterium]